MFNNQLSREKQKVAVFRYVNSFMEILPPWLISNYQRGIPYYSAIKRNEMEVFVMRWMELESVIQSEVSQKEKNKYSMLTHIYGI